MDEFLEKEKKYIRYRINDNVYEFLITDDTDEDILYGYCFELKKWAWLYPEYVFFKGEILRPAEKID